MSLYNVQVINYDIFINNIGVFILFGISSTVFNICMNFGIVFTYPLFISIGLMLDMPTNILYDCIINHLHIQTM